MGHFVLFSVLKKVSVRNKYLNKEGIFHLNSELLGGLWDHEL